MQQNNEFSARQQQQQQVLQPNEGQQAGRVPAYARVVIIGSGLAGLAAAQRLYEAGTRDVVILEAQNKPGGRVHTIAHSNYLLELGAQWLHGAHENPLYGWLSRLDMLADFEDASLGQAGKFCTSSRDELEPRLVARVLEIVNRRKLALFKDENNSLGHLDEPSEAAGGGASATRSASQAFRSQLELEIGRDPLLKRNRRLVQALFEWFLRYESIENGCDSMDEVSIESYTNYADWGEGTLLNFRRGYSSLLAWFCKQFPAEEWLHLSKQVLNVDSSGPSGRVQVTFRQASGDQEGQEEEEGVVCEAPVERVECDHVIVTCSLGFLKRHLNSFFTPPLPKPKRRLISSLGFGTVNKILLHFSQPFWQGPGIKLIWERDDAEAAAAEFPAWVRDITAFDAARRQPNVLVGWIGGQGAKLMEAHSDLEVGQICLRLLEKFLPPEQLGKSRLLGCLCTRWNSNPFTCGSYSFRSMSSLDMRMDKLHEPIWSCEGASSGKQEHKQLSPRRKRTPRVLFAGEATAGKLYSTTHGAIISGWREADRLASHLRQGDLQA